MLSINLLNIGPLCPKTCLQDKDLWLSSEPHHNMHQWDKCLGGAFQRTSRKFLVSKACSLPELRLVDTFQVNIAPERLNRQHKSCQQGMLVRLASQNQQDSSNQQGMELVAL